MNDEAALPLARQAFDLVKNTLLVNLRFMNTAFARLRPLPAPDATLATDGTFFRYDPVSLAQAYAAEPASVARAYLHVVLHNVFLHPYPSRYVDALRWDTACDLVVERTITELDLPATRTTRDGAQRPALARIDAALPLVTAETLYRHLCDQMTDDADVARLREPFYVDDHESWHRTSTAEDADAESPDGRRSEEPSNQAPKAAAGPSDDGTDVDLPPEAKNARRSHASERGMAAEDIAKKQAPENAAPSVGERFADTVNLDRSREQWKNAALETGIQLDSYVQLWGAKGANLAMNLKAVTREKQDYRAFLHKFARMGEHIRVNDDEFDYVYYCYGLQHYGNLPLIEPLEYVEEKRVRDFVIAIDTSASTKDGLVRRFVEKTYAILADETSFSADMNVLIIQCDAAVTHVARIANLRDLDDYLEQIEIKGLGGTDFRPVFSFVEDAIDRGDLQNLGGLIYFTDGFGTYPARKPAFDTAFVFLDDTAAAAAAVPSWAMKIALDETVRQEEERQGKQTGGS